MNLDIIYPSSLIIAGILISTIIVIFLTRASNKMVRYFELYPESKGILNYSLKFISWFIGVIIFLIFFRWSLVMLNLEFTKVLVEHLLGILPRYIVGVIVILLGVYVSRLIREKSRDYPIEYKDRILLVIDLIVYMTFIFTALYSIGVNISFFLEFYKVVLWIIGLIVALIISMTIGIPLGMSIYDKMKREGRSSRRKEIN
jgi:hypothetical protein